MLNMTVNKSLSTTYLPANQKYTSFMASYLDGSYSEGTNITDTLSVGSISMTNYPIGVVDYSSSQWIGVLGLGWLFSLAGPPDPVARATLTTNALVSRLVWRFSRSRSLRARSSAASAVPSSKGAKRRALQCPNSA